MMELFIYGIWYSFYGQFVFINHCIMWLLDLNDKCGVYGSPIQQTISFGDSKEIPIIIFMVSGLAWDAIILFGFSIPRRRINDSIIDDL